MLEDGRELVVSDGAVSEVKESGGGDEGGDAEALKKENESLKAELETLKASMIESSKALEESNEVNAKMEESVADIILKVEALELENKAMASVTVGGTKSVKAATKTPEVKKEENKLGQGMAGFLGL